MEKEKDVIIEAVEKALKKYNMNIEAEPTAEPTVKEATDILDKHKEVFKQMLRDDMVFGMSGYRITEDKEIEYVPIDEIFRLLENEE